MNYWSVSNPAKPKGIKDVNAILDFPIDFATWLADISDTYASHTVTVSGSIACNASSHAAGVITAWISGGQLGETASFTIRIVTTGGRTDDRTFYLKIVER